MEITEVRISLRDDQKLKAFVSITLDDCFVIRGLKIIEGGRGIFVAMPSRKRKEGDYQDIAHPIDKKTREWMEGVIISAYKEELAKAKRAGRTEEAKTESPRVDDSVKVDARSSEDKEQLRP